MGGGDDRVTLPQRFASVEELEYFLARPTPAPVDDLADVDGDLMILGVAGKMGPTLARLARQAAPRKRVIGVARFSDGVEFGAKDNQPLTWR